MESLNPILEEASDGYPLLSIEQNGKRIYLSSKYAPLQEATRIAEPFKEKPQDFVVVFGAGYLTLVKYLCSHLIFKYLVIIEPSPEIAKLAKEYIENHFNASVLSKIIFYQEDEYKELEFWFKNNSSNDVQLFVNRVQSTLFEEFYKRAYNEVIAFYNQKSINVATMSRFEKVWLQNVMKNTFHIAESPGVINIQNHFKGQKALIVAAGPSLKKHIDYLKQIQDKVILIAVDTIVKVLLHHNIIPHFVVVVDPQKINAKYVEDIPKEFASKMVFIFEPAVCQSALRDKPYLASFDTIFPYYDLITKHFGKRGEIDMGGNVSTTAYDVGIFLGFKEVGFVGLDMCFTKDAYHVEGTMYENHWLTSGERFNTFETKMHKLMDYKNLTPILDYNGKEAYLDTKFKMFIRWFEKKEKNKRFPTLFYNCGEGGFVFENIPNKLLHEFVPEDSPTINDIFSSSLSKLSPNKNLLWQPFIDELKTIKKNIENYLETLKEAMELCVKLQKYSHQESSKKLFLRLEELDEILMTHFEGKTLVNIAIQKAIDIITSKKVLNPTIEGSLKDSMFLYSEMKIAVLLNIEYMDNVLNLYETRYAKR